MVTTSKKIGSRAEGEFSLTVKDLIAKRSGYICAYPGCRRMTVAGSDDRESGLTITGVAAHITAAASGGSRYNENMGREERSSESNGIWTCQLHAKFIDDNPSTCTTEELQRWKLQHETWVFARVESGVELLTSGITRLEFSRIGIFDKTIQITLGRTNLLVGSDASGKTTLCQLIAAFSGRPHWAAFNNRFEFDQLAEARSFISATTLSKSLKRTVKLSPQHSRYQQSQGARVINRIHVEVDGNIASDWPRSTFKILHFDNQLSHSQSLSEHRDVLLRSIKYLSDVFAIDEILILDSLREEIYANSTFGFRFRHTSDKKIEIFTPHGRNFYSPELLSTSELSLAVIDIALKMLFCTASSEQWLLIFDTGFFGVLDEANKSKLFSTITAMGGRKLQTIFCLNSEEDVETLRQIQLENWIGGSQFARLTLHAFV